MKSAAALAVALMLVGSTSCQRKAGGLVVTTTGVSIAPPSIDFGSIYLLASASGTFSASSRGAGAQELALAISGDPAFALDAPSVTVPAGASTPVRATFTPTAAGTFVATIHATWSGGAADVALRGTALPWPTCAASSQCSQTSFNPHTGTCETLAIADGAACDSGDPCLSSTTCVQGQCVGQFNTCDDGNPCTTDACISRQGCIHLADLAACAPTTCTPPSGDGLNPGQVLWRFAPDSGPDSWLSLEALDSAGNSYLIDEGAPAVFSLDPCGQVRWSETLTRYPYGALLAGDMLLLQAGGMLESRSAASGQLLWQVDVAGALGLCDGGPCGATIEGDAYAGPAVLSNQGQIFITGSSLGPPWSLEVLAISLGGTVQWVESVGSINYTVGGANQVADQSGNLYFYRAGDETQLQVIDGQGHALFQRPSYDQTNLAVGPGFVVDLGEDPSTAWASNGQVVYTLSSEIVPSPVFSSSGVIDADGNLTFWPGAASTDTPGLTRVNSSGQRVASVIIAGSAMSELALDEAGRTYVLGIGDPQNFDLWCWDGHSSSLAFAADLGPAFRAGQQLSNGQNLLISNHLALLSINQAIEAVYIGPHGPSSAPWSRGYGGNNANQRSPSP